MVTKQKSKFLSVSFTFLVGFSVLFCSISQLGATESILYGAANNGPDGISTLYTIETSGPSAGVATQIGDFEGIGFERCSAMDYDESTGILYATCERADGSNTHVLITIDTVTGAGTEIGPTGVESLLGPGLGLNIASDISFRNSDNTLFAFTFPGDALAIIDLSTGAMTQLGFPSGANDVLGVFRGNGLAFSPLDDLFHTASNFSMTDLLMTLDHTTSAVTLASPMDFGILSNTRINGMDFEPDTGTLFASVKSGSFPSTSTLATVDTVTRVVSTIGTPTVDGLDALAFVFPVSTLTLTKTLIKFRNTPNNDRFEVKGEFVLDEDSDGIIDPITELVTVNVGTASIKIPPGSFLWEGGKFKFEGTIGDAHVKMKIKEKETGFNTFDFKMIVKGFDLMGLVNPVGIKVIVGNDKGKSIIRLKGELFKHKHNH